MTYMFILKCALKLVEEIILYYDARSKKHQITEYRLFSHGNNRYVNAPYCSTYMYIACLISDKNIFLTNVT